MAEDRDDAPGEDDFMIHAVTVDDYGVPSNLMGPHHEAFFALLGRIVALSARLENHVLVVYQSLVGAAQNEYTNVPVGKLLERCRRELHRLDGRPSHLGSWRSSCRRLRRSSRNGTTMSTTSGRPSQEGVYFGWRPPREKGAQEAITVEATLPEMRSDLASLVDLLEVRDWHRLLSVVSSTEC
jgi:hypothetical protein